MVPDFARLAAPRTMADADLNRRLLDVQQSQATARAAAEVRREEQPARVEEAGQTRSAEETALLRARDAETRRQEAEKLRTVISELERAIRPGGLLQQSTGSGVGRLRDIAGNFIGFSGRAPEAAAALAPIADMVLKMVPRFEGPQSDKDTASYQEAAGRLADPTIPNAQRLAAAREIIRLMKNRRDQFVAAGTEGAAAAPSAPAPAAPPAPAPAGFIEGQTATGPNGQRIVFRGGQWVPVQ
jgi:hypothetical protein